MHERPAASSFVMPAIRASPSARRIAGAAVSRPDLCRRRCSSTGRRPRCHRWRGAWKAEDRRRRPCGRRPLSDRKRSRRPRSLTFARLSAGSCSTARLQRRKPSQCCSKSRDSKMPNAEQLNAAGPEHTCAETRRPAHPHARSPTNRTISSLSLKSSNESPSSTSRNVTTDCLILFRPARRVMNMRE